MEQKDPKKSKRGGRNTTASPPTDSQETSLNADSDGTGNRGIPVTNFRWVIPAKSEIVLRVHFHSEDTGQFDQVYNFEIMGTNRNYQLFLRGIANFPSICREPRILFPQRKKNRVKDEIVNRKYIIQEELFEFGPLLIGKSRDGFKDASKYPENSASFVILNNKSIEAECTFCFLNDSKAETFLLSPPQMTLKPNEQQELKVWAFPKTVGDFEDTLVCCVRENPEPVTWKLRCSGARPEIEVDKKTLAFEKILLFRKETKSVTLKNNTKIPVAWRLTGLEALGDDFSVAADSGIIAPRSDHQLHLHFKASRPVILQKKYIRIEVSDAENVLGVIQTESIQVQAECYDVALDLMFPKTDNKDKSNQDCLEFGYQRVHSNEKQVLTLKNKGKYEFQVFFELVLPEKGRGKKMDDLGDIKELFSIQPPQETLPSGASKAITVAFTPKREVEIKELPILKCYIKEPSQPEQNQRIGEITIKVSAASLYSKFRITPSSDINFGTLLVNSKKTAKITIENTMVPPKGSDEKDKFDFKYTFFMLNNKSNEANKAAQGGAKGGRALASRVSTRSVKDGAGSGSVVEKFDKSQMITQSRLVCDFFTIIPGFAASPIPSGNSVDITVECMADRETKCEATFLLEITDANPSVAKNGILFKFVAEGCSPSVNNSNFRDVFEEHTMLKSIIGWQSLLRPLMGVADFVGGVFGESEKRFVFPPVLVSKRATARFKLSSNSRVPSDISISVRPISTTQITGSKHSQVAAQSAKNVDVFEVSPNRSQIPPKGSVYVDVTFCPAAIHQYMAVFEASLEGTNSSKSQPLKFDMMGEGHLPRISVTKPTVLNKRGQPSLIFRRTLLGCQDDAFIELCNDGTLPANVTIDIADPVSCFRVESLQPKPLEITEITDENESVETIKSKPICENVPIGAKAKFKVTFAPTAPSRSIGGVKIRVDNNPYEDTVVQLIGEAYDEPISISNVRSYSHFNETPVPKAPTGAQAVAVREIDERNEPAKAQIMNFGDVTLGELSTLSFDIVNKSDNFVKFTCPEHPQLKFSPQVGHIAPKKSKEIHTTLVVDQPVTYKETVVQIKAIRIMPENPDPAIDWDDKKKVVKWVDSSSTSKVPGAKKKVTETEAEPPFSEVPDSTKNLDLKISAIAQYAKLKCETKEVHFKDTLMFQTRFVEVKVHNSGDVRANYTWALEMPSRQVTEVGMEGFGMSRPITPGLVTPRPYSTKRMMSETQAIVPVDTPWSAYEDKTIPHYDPFFVEPSFGSIEVGQSQTFKVKFAPLDLGEMAGTLQLRLQNGNPEQPIEHEIAVKSRSLLPWCHFELEDSDYLVKRNVELCGPQGKPPGTKLDPNTRAIEFKVVGVGVTGSKVFSVLNPTNRKYHFEWVNDDVDDPKRVPNVICHTPHGMIGPGEKVHMQFDFTSSSVGLSESFWNFVIRELNISVPFVIVGEVSDPRVIFSQTQVNFKNMLVGYEASETIELVNMESSDLGFQIDSNSCHTQGFAAKVDIEPMNGVVPAKSSVPIKVTYSPKSEMAVNFNVHCKVEQKVMPVTVNVKAEGFTMHAVATLIDNFGRRTELATRGVCQVDFKEIQLNEKAVRTISLVNNGKFNFAYRWETSFPREFANILTIEPYDGIVNAQGKTECLIRFCPKAKMALQKCAARLVVIDGPSFAVQFSGIASEPGLHFSFMEHDFGPSFVYKPGLPPRQVTLTITNRDSREHSVECLYQTTPYLVHNMEQVVLIKPECSHDVVFSFYPREVKRYNEKVMFEMNGISSQPIVLRGAGSEFSLVVANPKHRLVKLGALKLNEKVKKVIPIVNQTSVDLKFKLSLQSTSNLLLNNYLSLDTKSKSTELVLRPKEQHMIEVTFEPMNRVLPFTEEVVAECIGITQPIFAVTGSCQAVNVVLDMDYISFGLCTLQSRSTRRILMQNNGDIGAKFEWEKNRFGPNFSVAPLSGYLTPGMSVDIEVSYHPTETTNEARIDKAPCHVEGMKKPLYLTLTGSCQSMPNPQKESLHFQTVVRQKETRSILVANRSNLVWNLRPVIDGEYFSGPELLTIEPQQNKPYEVTYSPVTMTLEGKKHTGSIFFALPDGQGLLYTVTGTADPPKVAGRIQREVPFKTQFVEVLQVENWLKRPQRFKMKLEMIKPDRLDAGTTIKGLEYVDVPGLVKKDYRLTFYAYKEATYLVKVSFINEDTNEYQFYEIQFKSVRGSALQTIRLTTPVRMATSHSLLISNPLPAEISMSVTASVSDLQFPSQLVLPAKSEGKLTIDYKPLKAGENKGKLEISHSELGAYVYDLVLMATTPAPEKQLTFNTSLGLNQISQAVFYNFSKQKTEYTCKVDHPDFHVDKTVAAAASTQSAGTEVSVDVTFEPSQQGEIRATLILSSAIGGEYVFPIVAFCSPPKPQGPFSINAGGQTPIIFRNVFHQSVTYSFHVDNPLFKVAKVTETVRAGKDCRIMLTFEGLPDGSPATGKLVIATSAAPTPEHPPKNQSERAAAAAAAAAGL